MAHHQQTGHDRMHATQAAAVSKASASPSVMHKTDEDDAGDADEPPDHQLRFSKITDSGASTPNARHSNNAGNRYRKASLLTQALTSPELTAFSDTEAPHLTSDGGLTSPARTGTPSPPLPDLSHPILPLPLPKDTTAKESPLAIARPADTAATPHAKGVDMSQETKVEEGLGRKRCISFACFQKTRTPSSEEHQAANKVVEPAPPATVEAPKRPCALRFVCPSKPVREKSDEGRRREEKGQSSTQEQRMQAVLKESKPPVASVPSENAQVPREIPVEKPSSSGHEPASTSGQAKPVDVRSTRSGPGATPQLFNRVDFQKSEATRFHEFAGSFTEEDEWTKEQTAFQNKITINDTLRKENAIRRLGEEAEAEALEDEEDSYSRSAGIDDVDDDDDDEESDGGNETDDEYGFGDSDDESDLGSPYQFWTPSVATAATSTDHIEHIRPMSHRLGSDSSIESVLKIQHGLERAVLEGQAARRSDRSSRQDGKRRVKTPEIPDSSDFVVGTIDEDQPLEEQYLSRRKRREQLKQKLVPQDIDPSFPNSDPEAENEEDDDEEDVEEVEEGQSGDRKASLSSTHSTAGSRDQISKSESQNISEPSKRSKSSSPKRRRSPAPPTRSVFDQNAHRLRSPPPMHRKITSPPSSRRPSPTGASHHTQGVPILRLAQRPNLTHTTSLPRTPNPFWIQHRKSGFYDPESPSTASSFKGTHQPMAHVPSRGPIDIIQGLETKTQRRKEKFWRQHTQIAHAGKEKQRKCQPGKGVERMREVGLEMAGRFKGYKQDTTQVILSV